MHSPAEGRCETHVDVPARILCARCGTFACGVCEILLPAGPHCPRCFETLYRTGKLGTSAANLVFKKRSANAFLVALLGLLLSWTVVGGYIGGGVGILLGALAIREAAGDPTQGRGEAITAIVLGIVAIGCATAMLVLVRMP